MNLNTEIELKINKLHNEIDPFTLKIMEQHIFSFHVFNFVNKRVFVLTILKVFLTQFLYF